MSVYERTADNDRSRIVRCIISGCDWSEHAESQTHAYALGRNHRHNTGHVVAISKEEQ